MSKVANDLSLNELRLRWSNYWGLDPSMRMGRAMLEASLEFRIWEIESGSTSKNIQKKLNNLVQDYRKNPSCFTLKQSLKPGMKLSRVYKGKKHIVDVTSTGLEYNGKQWQSLSKIANHITGSKWNGWVFFGLK